VSKYDAELRRRILRGDDLPRIGMWFIECIAKDREIRETDFTKFELMFWRDIIKNFEEWRRHRKLN